MVGDTIKKSLKITQFSDFLIFSPHFKGIHPAVRL